MAVVRSGQPGSRLITRCQHLRASAGENTAIAARPGDVGQPAGGARRPGSRLARRPADHHALRPGTRLPRPPRDLYRRRLHRRSRPVKALHRLARHPPDRRLGSLCLATECHEREAPARLVLHRVDEQLPALRKVQKGRSEHAEGIWFGASEPSARNRQGRKTAWRWWRTASRIGDRSPRKYRDRLAGRAALSGAVCFGQPTMSQVRPFQVQVVLGNVVPAALVKPPNRTAWWVARS